MSALPKAEIPDTVQAAFLPGCAAPVSEARPVSWPDLSDLLGRVEAGTKEGTAWMPASIEPGPRAGERVQTISALVLDVEAEAEREPDGSKRVIGPEPPPLEELAAELALIGWRAILHTSHSHTPEHPRYRAVFALSRPLDKGEVRPLGLHVASLLGIADAVDTGCLEPARLYYLPRAPRERLGAFEHRTIEGRPIDVDALLREATRARDALQAAQRRKAPPRSGSVIEAFNAAHDVGEVIEAHGYIPKGRNRWLFPGSTSRMPGVRLLPESDPPRIYSSHAGDPLNDGRAHDAFDVFRILGNEGDTTDAVREAARLLGMDTRPEPPQAAPEPHQDTNERRRLLVPVSEIRARLRPPQYLIRHYLETETFAQLFGEPGAGKSFMALDWGMSVATGKDWHGHTVRPGPVVIVAGEGHAGMARRVTAWELHHGIQAEYLHVSRRAVPMLEGESMAELIAELDALPAPPVLIEVDTLARAFAGREENSTTDMGLFVNACDTLRQRFGCTVLVIHHPGHGDKGRGRGASNLKGALDAEYGLHRAPGDPKGPAVFSCFKLKDGEPPPPLMFRLESVPLPLVDDEGQPVTSAVPVLVEGESEPKRARMTGSQRYAVETLLQATLEGAAALEAWREAFYRGHPGDTSEAKKKAFQRARNDLLRAGAVRVEDDVYTLTPDACAWGDLVGIVTAYHLTKGDRDNRDKSGTCPGLSRDNRDTPL